MPDMSETKLKLLMAMTPALAAASWKPMDTVPKDGTEVQVRIVHMLAAYSDDPHEDGYIATAKAHWIDHNGGGMTWHGLAGEPCQWRHLGER
jgi:hypothetical protein